MEYTAGRSVSASFAAEPILPLDIPVDALVIYEFSTPAQQHMQAPIAEARLFSCQLHQAYPQVFIRVPRLVTAARH